ncbi:hypothetical protein CMI48_04220, partial [Candidatus Pacearchaeota archaeon]|nr:hypothetical protein [Candidatus Pacearchaeota archaeon]
NPEMVAQRLGVLADIAILDRITGQSITKEAVDYARNRHNLISEAGLDEEESAEDNFVLEAAARAGISEEDLLSANAHNSAFLIPNPIRAVFSENFMVDGYVNSVTVSFQKFSPEMIPTVAIVDISMHAIYQGFARKKTIFSDLLKMQASERYPPPDGEEGDPLADDRKAPAATFASNLQEIGARHPRVLTGIDHSPPQSEGWMDAAGDVADAVVAGLTFGFFGSTDGLGDNKIPSPSYTRLSKHKKVEGTTNSFKMQDGITFTPMSYFGEGTRALGTDQSSESLGPHIKRNIGKSTDYISNLSAETHMGLSIRARLRATSKPLLERLVGGGEGGMTDPNNNPYVSSSAFFVSWSAERRKELFAIGLENSRVTGGERDTLWQQFAATSPANLYTRSFPIIQLPGPGEQRYGDFVDMYSFVYNDLRVTNDNWIYCADYEGNKWQEADTAYTLASGFYIGDDPFPETLTIAASVGNGHVDYPVEYQMRLLFRTFLRYREPTNDQSYTVSDTGWLAIHPRDENTQLMKEGDNFIVANNRDTALNGDLAGVNVGTGLDSAYPWLTDLDTNLHFDGQLDGASSGASGTKYLRGDHSPDGRWITSEGIVT